MFILTDTFWQAAAGGSRKRAASPNASADSIRVTKQAKTAEQITRERVKAGDYKGIERALLKLAQVLYRCTISTIDAFPVHKLEIDLACAAWAEACNSRKTDIELDDDQLKLVRASLLLAIL